MILIGQFDSAFVRRVGIALRLYGIDFEHRPWSVFADVERLAALNPLGSVPTLVLDDGTALIDSKTILDHLDTLVAPEDVLWPQNVDERRKARQIAALATGLADRMVSLFYERQMHDTVSDAFDGRRTRQVKAALDLLEAERAGRPGPWWFGRTFGHADVAVACTLRHLRESLPGLFDARRLPALADHAAAMEALPVLKEISQPFVAPG